ncbi:MAG: hypothetical protein ACR2NR_00175 [Solirubrobacteraceae bacterium]
MLLTISTTQRPATDLVGRDIDAYRRYIRPVNGIDDLRLAPFHGLAAETGVFVDLDHAWHVELCDRLVASDTDWFTPTKRLIVDTTDPGSQSAGVAWWEPLTAGGGEGMVVKPMSFVANGRKGLAQPGIKCRGPDECAFGVLAIKSEPVDLRL